MNVKGSGLTGVGEILPFGPFPQMKTYLAKKETVQPKWYLIDAEGKVLGRLAVKAANILRGRHKPTYTPHVDTGDFVVVINANKVVLTGKKEETTEYMSFSGYVGGEKYRKLADVRKQLQQAGAQDIREVRMAQGQKQSRFVAWTFLDDAQREAWRMLRGRDARRQAP
mgnify:CR=1 FL=1